MMRRSRRTNLSINVSHTLGTGSNDGRQALCCASADLPAHIIIVTYVSRISTVGKKEWRMKRKKKRKWTLVISDKLEVVGAYSSSASASSPSSSIASTSSSPSSA